MQHIAGLLHACEAALCCFMALMTRDLWKVLKQIDAARAF
jgi:hypothetical protein